MTAMTLSAVNIEVMPKSTLGNIKIWSIKDSSGRTVCYFDAERPLKDCTHRFSSATHIRVDYKIAGEWPDGSTALFDTYGYNNVHDRKLVQVMHFQEVII